MFFVPVFYVVLQSLAEMWMWRKKSPWIEDKDELPLFAELEAEPALAR